MRIFQDLKKYVTDLLTQKDTEGVNFQPKKIRRTSTPVIYTGNTPSPWS